MAASIEEYRKHRLEAQAKAANEALPPTAPIDQVAVENSLLTGDEKLDKMVRALEALIEPVKSMLLQISEQGMGVMDDVSIRKMQVLYAYHRGRVEAWTEATQLPKRIVAESKLIS